MTTPTKAPKTRAERMFFVVPAEGLRIRLHHKPTEHLPRTGDWVPRTIEWKRAILSKDVRETTPPKPKRAKPAKSADK